MTTQGVELYWTRPVSPSRILLPQRPGNILALELLKQLQAMPVQKFQQRKVDSFLLDAKPSPLNLGSTAEITIGALVGRVQQLRGQNPTKQIDACSKHIKALPTTGVATAQYKQTLPTHQHDISVHDTCATCVLRPLPADLWAIVDAWESLPDAMKAGMEAMVRAARP